MNKQELAAQVAADTGLPATTAQKAIDSFLNAVSTNMQNRITTRIVGFGTFEATERAARDGRNPQTGATLKIPASVQAKFKPGQTLKDALNNNTKKK